MRGPKFSRGMALAIITLIAALVILGIQQFAKNSQSSNSTLDTPTGQKWKKAQKRPSITEQNLTRIKSYENRGNIKKIRRTAKATIAENGINSTFGYIILEGLEGNPQRGDEAYIAQLGPDAGLLTVEDVDKDEGHVLLEFDSIQLSDLKEGDVVELMPPMLPD